MYVIYIKTIVILSICSLFFVGTHSFAATPANVDMSKIKTTWISRTNGERKSLKLTSYTGNTLLDTSAQQRAEYLQTLGKTTHQRLTGDGYYNYRSIQSWFALQHVGFSNAEGTMFSESLGRGYYRCTQADCTDALIKAIKSTWNFFMSEKYKKSRPHYNAIVSKNFNSVGLGIAVTKNRYYLVSHYGKNVMKIK
ncbi:MAG: CAP domain-containing protein [Candidatus Absconditabacterales bacterium]